MDSSDFKEGCAAFKEKRRSHPLAQLVLVGIRFFTLRLPGER